MVWQMWIKSYKLSERQRVLLIISFFLNILAGIMLNIDFFKDIHKSTVVGLAKHNYCARMMGWSAESDSIFYVNRCTGCLDDGRKMHMKENPAYRLPQLVVKSHFNHELSREISITHTPVFQPSLLPCNRSSCLEGEIWLEGRENMKIKYLVHCRWN